MPGTSRPATAMAVRASTPKSWGSQARRSPASAASRTASTTAPRPPPPTMIPMSTPALPRRSAGRAEDEVEPAGVAVTVGRLELRDQRRAAGADAVLLQPGVAGEVHLGGERLEPVGLQPDVEVGRPVQPEAEQLQDPGGVGLVGDVVGRRYDGPDGERAVGAGGDPAPEVPL